MGGDAGRASMYIRVEFVLEASRTPFVPSKDCGRCQFRCRVYHDSSGASCGCGRGRLLRGGGG